MNKDTIVEGYVSVNMSEPFPVELFDSGGIDKLLQNWHTIEYYSYH